MRKTLVNSIHSVRGEHVVQNMEELKKTETMSVGDYCRYKKDKMDQLLNYIKHNIKYYSQREFTSDGNLYNCMPIVDKKMISVDMDLFIDPQNRLSWRSTSGSTGTPFKFPKDHYASGYMDALMYNAYSWHGIQLGDRQARLWGRVLKKHDRLIQQIKDAIFNRKRLSVFEMSDSACLKYFQTLKHFKPKFFYAYSNALYQFACFVENNEIDGKSLEVTCAICTGEVLFPYQRDKIKDIFGCNVINEYGSTENGIIGFECEYGKMHVMPTIHVEIDEMDEHGYGAILITELNSRSIPFVRYKIGDVGKINNCACDCGKPYEILELREGRIDGYILRPDGNKVYDAILAYSLKDYVIQFRAYQNEINQLDIYIVPNDKYKPLAEIKIKQELTKYLGTEITINIITCEALPFDKSGKYRYFISKMNQ